MTTPNQLLEQNRDWARRMQTEQPDLFDNLVQGQAPEVLWIGCADSRVPATQVVNAGPGDLFVHRNVANLVVESDPNSMSVLHYAVEALEVPHIIVCGHYGCGGVQAALQGVEDDVLAQWLQPLRDLIQDRADTLDRFEEEARWDRCCELNVEAQVRRLARTPVVQQAWERGQDLVIHGWVYQLEDGQIQNLDVSIDGPAAEQA